MERSMDPVKSLPSQRFPLNFATCGSNINISLAVNSMYKDIVLNFIFSHLEVEKFLHQPRYEWNQKSNGFYFTAERRDVQLHRRLHGHVAGNLPGGSLRFCGDPGVPGHLHVQEQEEGEGSAQLLTSVVSAINASIRCV
ncbi:hypothetical protein AVEN_126195-1 [Araneus ventricosus]|uniref:Uncharacterized protein n=1 Tax=Araneus ventricosus TaxID=182803 RepID=A0A4Y2LG01_ARAVE|nr:hypothetical protein AVEN_126195-1 [Araneus ventricosus]